MNKVDIPPPEGVFAQSWSLKKIFGMLAVFGPAAIVASVAIGAGETIVVVRAGAWAGYGLLWMVLLSCSGQGRLLHLSDRPLHSRQRRADRPPPRAPAWAARLAAVDHSAV